MRPLFAVTLAAALVACGSPPPAAAPPPVASAPPPAPAPCAANTPRQPTDVKPKMSSLGDEVRRCFLLGGPTDQPVNVKAELVVSDDGKVKKASASGVPSSRKGASECVNKALAAAKFASFCGDDVALSWTFTIQ